jgi:amino acid transporter
MSSPGLTVHTGSNRKLRGSGSLLFFTVSASAPMTVLAGGILATFAVGGSIGVPLSYPILAVALGLFTVGYAAMSRHVSNAGAFYTYLAKGLGGSFGVGGSFVALLSYNMIQIGLYGLFGFAANGFAASHWAGSPVAGWHWWVWALIAWLLVALLGVLRIDLNAKVLGVLLIAEVIAVVLFDFGAITKPADGSLSFAGFQPGNLFTSGVGAVFAFGIAAFVGFESGTSYSEEVRDSRRTVARATYGALLITGVLYSVSAWAMTLSVGPSHVVDAARDPASGLPFAQMAGYFGGVGNTIADVANVLLITSVFAALLSFHNAVARYSLALGRERVLPSFLGSRGRGSGAPIAGSVLQSILGVVSIVAFAAAGRDPLLELFTWFSYVAAVGVLLLMLTCSFAVIGYFSRRPNAVETVWQRMIAPILAILALAVILAVVVLNSDALLGAEKGSLLTYILPGLVGAAAILGLIWGAILRSAKPEVYAGIGRGLGDDDDDLDGPARPSLPSGRHGNPDSDLSRLQV